MHDSNLDERLRSMLRREGDSLPFTITTDELERRLALRRRARSGQRLSLMAAGLAILAVGAVFAFGSGWLRSTNVAADPSRSPTASSAPSPDAIASPANATPTPVASGDPLAALPAIERDPTSIDYDETYIPSVQSGTGPDLWHRPLDGVRMDAREAGIKVACIGPDARVEWWLVPGRSIVASEPVVCDGTVNSFRFDLAAHQPMLGQVLFLQTAPQTAFRVLVETFGFMNDPVRTVLPTFAIPQGTVAVDFTNEPDPDATAESVQTSAGSVPSRGQYRVALACVGGGTIRWDIGADRLAGGGDQPCDGSALGFQVVGVPPEDTPVLVTTSPRNHWRIVVTHDPDVPAFIAPVLMGFAGQDLEGEGAGALALCVNRSGSADSCGVPFLARDGAREVVVPVDSSLGLALADGWGIDNGGVEVMERDAARRDPFGESRRLTRIEDGGLHVGVPLTGLEPGEWVIRVSLNGSKGDDTFGGVYSIPVVIVE